MTRAAAAPPAPARRWRIVLDRDARYDGTFVYGVRSTRIYCRPSCPARRPRRARVQFFALPELAERAGFRPCRRCHPRAARPDATVALVREACRAIDARPGGPLDLATLATHAATTPRRLSRTFRAVLGLTPRQYWDERRLERLKAELRNGRAVTPALYAAGYGAPSRVYERARARLGMTPATYGRGGRGARIRYAVIATELGHLLVAATDRGVCRVAFGERRALKQSLRREFPAAVLESDERGLGTWVRTLRAHLAGRLARVDLPLDVHATAFQWRVWRALCDIPYGATRSYTAVARAIGREGSARAVARACAANPAALLVPCHRVVRADGTPGGYRWGVRRKRALLDAEALARPALASASHTRPSPRALPNGPGLSPRSRG